MVWWRRAPMVERASEYCGRLCELSAAGEERQRASSLHNTSIKQRVPSPPVGFVLYVWMYVHSLFKVIGFYVFMFCFGRAGACVLCECLCRPWSADNRKGLRTLRNCCCYEGASKMQIVFVCGSDLRCHAFASIYCMYVVFVTFSILGPIWLFLVCWCVVVVVWWLFCCHFTQPMRARRAQETLILLCSLVFHLGVHCFVIIYVPIYMKYIAFMYLWFVSVDID